MVFIANTELFLYGHPSLSDTDNREILALTLEYRENQSLCILIMPPITPLPFPPLNEGSCLFLC